MAAGQRCLVVVGADARDGPGGGGGGCRCRGRAWWWWWVQMPGMGLVVVVVGADARDGPGGGGGCRCRGSAQMSQSKLLQHRAATAPG